MRRAQLRKLNKAALDLVQAVAKEATQAAQPRRNWRRLPDGVSYLKRQIANRKRDALRAGKVWELTQEQALALLTSPCVYCGAPPIWHDPSPSRARRGVRGAAHGGIDRLNPQVGYVLSNCVPACWPCNDAKRAFSLDHWLAVVLPRVLMERAHQRLNQFLGALS